jgi:hypothetical protein
MVGDSLKTRKRGDSLFRKAAKLSTPKWWWISDLFRVVTMIPCAHWTSTFIFVFILVFTSRALFELYGLSEMLISVDELKQGHQKYWIQRHNLHKRLFLFYLVKDSFFILKMMI